MLYYLGLGADIRSSRCVLGKARSLVRTFEANERARHRATGQTLQKNGEAKTEADGCHLEYEGTLHRSKE